MSCCGLEQWKKNKQEPCVAWRLPTAWFLRKVLKHNFHHRIGPSFCGYPLLPHVSHYWLLAARGEQLISQGCSQVSGEEDNSELMAANNHSSWRKGSVWLHPHPLQLCNWGNRRRSRVSCLGSSFSFKRQEAHI